MRKNISLGKNTGRYISALLFRGVHLSYTYDSLNIGVTLNCVTLNSLENSKWTFYPAWRIISYLQKD